MTERALVDEADDDAPRSILAIRLMLGCAAVFALLKIVYLVRAVVPVDDATFHVVRGSDTPTYLDASKLSIFSKAFYQAPGPFGFLVLMKLVARNLRALVMVQTLLSIVAWCALAMSVRSAMTTATARLVGFAGVLLTGLAPAFAMWEVATGTESLAITVAVVALALGIRLAVRIDNRTVVAFVAAMVVAAFTHDIDAIIAGGLGLVALGAIVVPRWRHLHLRRLLASALVLLSAAGAETALSNAGRRWYWPVAETLTLRIAASPDGYRWLVAHGMPDDGAVRALQANYFLTYPGFQDNAPAYRALRHWLDAKGRSSYTNYLVSHPKFVLTEPRHSLADQFTPNVAPIATAQHIGADPVMRWLGAVGLPGFRGTLWWAIAAGACFLAAFTDPAARKRRRLGLTIAAIALIVVPHALAVFHGDYLELARHSLTLAVQARVVVWIATAFALDVLVMRCRGRRPSPRASIGDGVATPSM